VSVVGLDMETLALHFCRERGHKALVIGSATALPFPNHSFSAIVAMDVLEHIPDHETAAREIARVLGPGGLLYATVPAHRSLWSSHDIALMHQRRYARGEFTQLLATSGLSLVHHSYTVSALLPTVWAIRTARRKLRPHAPPKADIGPVPAPLNAVLRHGLKVENALALRRRIPFGVSLFAVAQK
jgi:ubiquinone/menaquinone biosynthesis C-methylase UbiE